MKQKKKWYLFLLMLIPLGALIIAGGNLLGSQPVRASNDIPSQYFAPYLDIGGSTDRSGTVTNLTLSTLSQQSGVKDFTLGFIIASGCTPIWGGSGVKLQDGFDNNIGNGSATISNNVKNEVADLQNAGGNVIIAFGGSTGGGDGGGQELAQACPDATSLEQQYQAVIDRYNVDHIDLDIEGPASKDTASVARRDTAIAQLQKDYQLKHGKPLHVSYTLSVTWNGGLPKAGDGFENAGYDVLSDALAKGVNVDIVNIMAMDFMPCPTPACDTDGSLATKAADQVYTQLESLNQQQQLGAGDLHQKIGITPIIPLQNGDVAEQPISLTGLQTLVSYAQQNHIGALSMWNINRDVSQQYAYTKVFEGFSGSGGVTSPPVLHNVIPSPSASPVNDVVIPLVPSVTASPSVLPSPSASVVNTGVNVPGNKGEWTESGFPLYNPGDTVTYQGKTYICLRQIWGERGWEPNAPGIIDDFWTLVK